MSSEQEQNDQQQQPETPKSKIRSRNEIERESGAAERRRPTPPTILVYVVIVIFTFAYGLLIPGEPTLAFDQRLAITVFFRLMIIFLLVNRSFIGWVLGVLFEALQIILVALLIDPPGGVKVWGMLFLHTVALALLLTGLTRQHIFSRREESLTPPADQPDESTGESPPDAETPQGEDSASSSSRSSST